MARPPSAPQAAIFYNFINRSQYLYNGGPLIAHEKVVRNATLDEVTAFAQAGTLFAESPQHGQLAGRLPALPVHGNQEPAGQARAGKELPGQRRVPARHRLQHDGRNRVGHQLRPQLLAHQELEQHRAVHVRAIRRICSTTSRSPRTSCAAIIRAWGTIQLPHDQTKTR